MSFPNQFNFKGGSNADGTRPLLGTTWGTAATPAAGSYGSYVSLGVPHATEDCYGFEVGVNLFGATGADRTGVFKIGMDLAGGTSFTDTGIEQLIGSPESNANARLSLWRYEWKVPAAASIGIAFSASTLTTATRAWLQRIEGDATRPELLMAGTTAAKFGTVVATCVGTTVTPGTTAEGDWFEIGTLAAAFHYWEYGLAITDTAVAANIEIHTDIAVGASDSTTVSGTKRIIIANHPTWYNTNEVSWRNPAGAFHACISGEKLYARCQSSGALDDSVYSIGIVGIGGSELVESGGIAPRPIGSPFVRRVA